jgi:hypothetical protein
MAKVIKELHRWGGGVAVAVAVAAAVVAVCFQGRVLLACLAAGLGREPRGRKGEGLRQYCNHRANPPTTPLKRQTTSNTNSSTTEPQNKLTPPCWTNTPQLLPAGQDSENLKKGTPQTTSTPKQPPLSQIAPTPPTAPASGRTAART